VTNDAEPRHRAWRRINALLAKDLLDLRQNPGIFWPALLTAAVALALPFMIAIVIPMLTGERFSDSSDFEMAVEMYRDQPGTRALDPEGAIQAFIFQQFLPLLVLAPIAASMSVAAASVIGEKQARTLEPLLATPITTGELLTAKVLGSLLPALALTLFCYGLYSVGVAAFARPGVHTILLAPRSLGVVFLLGPLAALAALQLAVCVSSRVNDPRSAQQIGALIILPLTGVLIAQLSGHLALTMPIILLIAGGLVSLNLLLIAIGITLFNREAILTRWS
jgi:ABC-2 type transport system permease protein